MEYLKEYGKVHTCLLDFIIRDKLQVDLQKLSYRFTTENIESFFVISAI
jgi:hypothetical protein